MTQTSWLGGYERYAVFGMGVSGVAAAQALARRGKRVVLSDLREPANWAAIQAQLGDQVELVIGRNVWQDAELVIASPGMPPSLPIFAQIAAAGVPVIVDPIANLPRSFSELGATEENAARLDAAGVTVILKTGSGVAHRARELRYGAGNAVAWGLPHAAAVAAITINPARIFGVSNRIGSLDPGKEADLVLWNGDPLEPLSQPQAIFVRGMQMPLAARPLELRDRYLTATP